ncbi:hypothetical protein D9619_006511 [Psilocybe cf. subviscida]|uniref:F-box domain-containing protein n=1 Tax=Psilocybe cf. subviscida TaxID=2480587 RepID=A0A8H5EY69_9AGAR|nr:hypothetical protein D9619_006511 [Psilocybe cf. subviscida]
MPSPSVNTPVSEARTAIDQDIEAHERSIQKLKARRNALAPILKLPPELLHRIFVLIKDDSERLSEQGRTHLPTNAALCALRTWNVVTHVCNRWRQIALNASSLWTEPPIDSKPWTLEMLKRSKTAGLILDLTSDTPSTNNSVIRHIKHIKTLKIHYESARELNILFMGLFDDAPQLENLSITVNVRHSYHPGYSHAARDRDLGGRFVLQPSTFRGTKSLRRLTLSGVDIKWDSALFQGLTHLSLRNLSAECKPSWKQLMDMLEQMPDLQALDLDRAFPAGTSTSTSPPLHLPHLNELAVYSVFTEVHSFFSRITFPRLKRLYMGCRSAESGSVDYASVITALSRSCRATDTLGVAAIRKLELHQRMAATYGFCIEGFSDLARPNRINSVESDLEFLFGPPMGDDPTLDAEDTHPDNKIVRDVFSRLSFVNVTDLSITAGIALNARVIADSFGRLPRLGTVRISSSTSREMIKALTVKDVDELVAKPDGVLFPALHTIVFEWVAFSPHAPYDPRVEELQDLLMQRCEYGAPIQHLRFNFCRFLKRTDIARFAEIVPDVHWDEQEIGFWSEDNSDTDTDDGSDPLNAFFGDIDLPFYEDGYASIW